MRLQCSMKASRNRGEENRRERGDFASRGFCLQRGPPRDRKLVATLAGDGKCGFDRLADPENGAVRSVETRQHQSDRSISLTMTRHAQRAAVEKIDQCRIAKHEEIEPMVELVIPL